MRNKIIPILLDRLSFDSYSKLYEIAPALNLVRRPVA